MKRKTIDAEKLQQKLAELIILYNQRMRADPSQRDAYEIRKDVIRTVSGIIENMQEGKQV